MEVELAERSSQLASLVLKEKKSAYFLAEVMTRGLASAGVIIQRLMADGCHQLAPLFLEKKMSFFF